MATPIRIQIDVDEHGAVKGIQSVQRELTAMEKAGVKTNEGLGKTNNLLSSMRTILPAVTAGFVAYKALGLAKYSLEVAGGFERMQISLDTITKGQGEQWFKSLNEWAMKMPINTEKAIKAFTMMKAMGLNPMIKDMTTLVDTTSALGGQADTLEGIARALGQIQTKGKVSAEELMQLAERGIPAYEILREKLKLTGDQVANIGNLSIDGTRAVEALLQGMNERFGGQSEKIRDTYGGIIEEIRSNWIEFTRLMMDSGPFEFVKNGLRSIRQMTANLAAAEKQRAFESDAAAWFKSQGINPTVTAQYGTGSVMGGVSAMARPGVKYSDDAYRRYENYLVSQRKSTYAGVPTSPGLTPEYLAWESQAIREQKAMFERMGLAPGGLNVPGAPSYATPKLGMQGPGMRRYGSSGMSLNAGLAGLGPTPEEIKAQQERIAQIRRQIDEQTVRMAEDKYSAEIDLLKKRYDTEYGMLQQNDELRLAAAEKLKNDIMLIENDRMANMENRLMQFASTWSGMMDQLVGRSGNSFKEIGENFKDMLASMAQRAAIAGIGNLLFNFVPGGFGAGAMTFLSKSFGFAGGGYTGSGGAGDYAGVVHKREYVMPSDVVDSVGPSFFDRLVGAIKSGGSSRFEIHNTFSGTEKRDMMAMDDQQLADRITRLIHDRKVRMN